MTQEPQGQGAKLHSALSEFSRGNIFLRKNFFVLKTFVIPQKFGKDAVLDDTKDAKVSLFLALMICS